MLIEILQIWGTIYFAYWMICMLITGADTLFKTHTGICWRIHTLTSLAVGLLVVIMCVFHMLGEIAK